MPYCIMLLQALILPQKLSRRLAMVMSSERSGVALSLIHILLGAFLVKLGLTAQSQSPLRPAYLALHLTNTLLLLAALTLTCLLYTSRCV